MSTHAPAIENVWLADFFKRQREIIEAAETPFAKLAVFVLPIMSPLVPAFMTGMHLYKLLEELFVFRGSNYVSLAMAAITSIVLELLGYVGAITFISSVFRYIKTRNIALLIRLVLNGLAYGFYIAAMWAINYQLGKYFEFPTVVNNVFGLLSFITIPTGLLAADHLSQRAEDDDAEKVRSENREDKLKRFAIKHGLNPWGSSQPLPGQGTQLNASDFRIQMIEALNKAYESGVILKVVELGNMFNLDYAKSKGYISSLRRTWATENNVSLPK